MFDKLEEVVARYEELHTLLSSPEVLNDPKRMIECNKNLNALTPLIEKYKEYKAVKEDVDFIKESLKTEKDEDRKSTRLNSSHANISYAVFCLKKKNKYT